MALHDAFKESGETSAMEFLALGKAPSHFQELTERRRRGLGLSDSTKPAVFSANRSSKLHDI